MWHERFVFNFFDISSNLRQKEVITLTICFKNRDFYLHKMNKNYSAILLHKNYNTKIIFLFVIVQTISKEIVKDSTISTLNTIFKTWRKNARQFKWSKFN